MAPVRRDRLLGRGFLRQAEDPLAQDVAHDLVRPARDAHPRHAEQVLGPGVGAPGTGVGHQGRPEDRRHQLVGPHHIGGQRQLAQRHLRPGQLPGPEMSLGKLSLTANMVRTYELVSSIFGPALVADTGAWGTYAWTQYLLGVPGMRIAGGSDEVMRNILGERVLGLPKEPSPK